MASAGLETLVASGRLGRKSGAGFYEYEGSKRRGPSKEAYAALGAQPNDRPPLTKEEVVDRLILLMVNEAAYCLADGVVARPGKLDLAMIFGTGFPPFRGGLLKYADVRGTEAVRANLDDLAARHGPRYAPAPFLAHLAQKGGSFYG
jgi:3-hydroxyacyl-CoA dehydrogenase/enoyl-CoA hydratase/3-hydroxybutyryl-CoA epimerase